MINLHKKLALKILIASLMDNSFSSFDSLIPTRPEKKLRASPLLFHNTLLVPTRPKTFFLESNIVF